MSEPGDSIEQASAIPSEENAGQNADDVTDNVIADDIMQDDRRSEHLSTKQEPAEVQAKPEVISGGRHLKKFLKKVNGFSWKNVQGNFKTTHPDLSQPDMEFYPQMKNNFQLLEDEYPPQDGFSASFQPKGQTTDLKSYVDITQMIQNKPCMILGNHGSGKSILMRRLAKTFLIANRLERYQRNEFELWSQVFAVPRSQKRDYDLVLHINARDITNTRHGTLAEVIFIPSLTGLTKKELQHGMTAILQNKIRVIMFFDGLDQATWIPELNGELGPWDKASTAAIFGNILAGNLLSDVPITVSAIEHTIAILSKEMQPDVKVALTGFSESDAKSLYCDLTSETGDTNVKPKFFSKYLQKIKLKQAKKIRKELMNVNGIAWDEMMRSNPTLHSMCLSPTVLTFYLMSKKKNRSNPPDCITTVMLQGVELLLDRNSEQMNERLTVLNKLKRMAFEGTKDRRLSFSIDDMESSNLSCSDICNINIKVTGLDVCTQKLLHGTNKLNFIHQALQEFLAAIFIVEMDFEGFRKIVGDDFHEAQWSVVRTFTFGMLKSEQMGKTASELIVRADDTARKYEYLKKHLQSQLGGKPSPTEKLEIFAALKEGNALGTLKAFITNLDLSNSSLTSAKINILSCALRNMEKLSYLSLANSGIDEELMRVLARGTDGLNIKIGELDMTANTACRDIEVWESVFYNFIISTLSMDIVASSNHSKADALFIIQLIETAAANKIQKISFGKLTSMRLSLRQLQTLNKSVVEIKIPHLRLRPRKQEVQRWRCLFKEMSIVVEHCFVENPEPVEGRVDVQVWTDVAESARVTNVKEVSLTSTEIYSLTIEDIASINALKLKGEIEQIRIKPDPESFDVDIWRRTLHQMTLTVQHCLIEAPQSSEEATDVTVWLNAANEAKSANFSEVSLFSTEERPITVDDVIKLKYLGNTYKIQDLCVTAQSPPFQADVWRQAFQDMSSLTRHCSVGFATNDKGRISIRTWAAAAKAIKASGVEVSLNTTERIPLKMDDVMKLIEHKELPKISRLWIEPDVENFDEEKNKKIWTKKFDGLDTEIDHCLLKLPSEFQENFHVGIWIKSLETVCAEKVKKISMKSTKPVTLTILQLRRLRVYPIEISQLWIKSTLHQFVEDVWFETFQEGNLKIGECYVIPPDLSQKRDVDVMFWLKAAEIASVENVKDVILKSILPIELSISGVKLINDSEFDSEIAELWIRPDSVTFKKDVWEETFRDFKIYADRCYVDTPFQFMTGLDASVWINAVEAANAGHEEIVVLKSVSRVEFSINDVKRLCESGLRGEIRQLTLKDKQLSSDGWKQLGFIMSKYGVTTAFLPKDASLPDLQSFAEGHGNVKNRKIEIWGLDLIFLRLKHSKSSIDSADDNTKFLEMHLPDTFLVDKPRDCGRFIRDVGFNEVVFQDWSNDLDIPSFSSGLGGFKIECLRLESFTGMKVTDFVRQCNVNHLYLNKDLDEEILETLIQYTEVIFSA